MSVIIIIIVYCVRLYA